MRPSLSGRFRPALPLLLVLTLLPLRAHAALPGTDVDAYTVDRRGQDRIDSRPLGVVPPLDGSPEWTGFLVRHPGWTARRDTRTGRVERLSGPPAGRPGLRPVTSAMLESTARAFLVTSAAPFVPANDALDFVRGVSLRNQHWAHFAQRVNGVPVWGSRVSVHLTLDGRATQVTNRAFPDIDATTTPVVDAASARQVGRQDLPTDAAEPGSPELVLLPIERNRGTEFRLAWSMSFTTMDPPGHWVTFVDALTGDLLWRFNDVKHAEVTAHVHGPVEPRTQGDTPVDTPLRYVGLAIEDSTVNPAGVTDSLGNALLVTPATTGRVLQGGLAGPRGAIFDFSQAFSTPTFGDTLPDGDNEAVDLLVDDATTTASGRSAFHWTMVAHDWIKALDPGFTALDYQLPIVIEVPLPGPNQCNAFWNGFANVYFEAGTSCANAARVATVVMHEYGHAITDYVYRPFYPSGAMHEGFSDYLACAITNQPIVGPGWRPTSNPSYIRRIDVDRKWPDDAIGQVHNDGLIIASTLWDLRELLGPELADSLWHYARYGYADTFDDYFLDYLRTDDDDGNIYNGTPHFDAIVGRFRAHGIGDYSIHVAHVPRPDTEDLASAPPITASFLSIFPLTPGSVTLHLEIEKDGVVTPSAVPMSPTGGVREFTHLVPAQEAGTTIRYWFTAEDTAGASVTWPPEGGAAPFEFRVGPDTEAPVIVHLPLEDQPLDTPAVPVLAEVSDNLDRLPHAVQLHFRRDGGPVDSTTLEPLGTPEPAVSSPYAGLLPLPEAQLGETAEYRISAVDSAAAPNTGHHPGSGWHAFRIVRGFARNFEDDNGGLSGNGDWQWGIPGPGIPARSGMSAWGTVLDGPYHDNLVSTLELPPVDLSPFERAALVFHHWLDCEEIFDGGIVEASIDGGKSWDLLTPEGGYPYSFIVASGLPGFSGSSDGWRPVEFDVGRFLPQTDVRFRLRFFTDSGVVGPGWYIDDLQVVERQLRVRPAALRAESDRDGRVPLEWDPPPFVDDGPGGPVLGYNVYRADAPGSPLLLLTQPPVSGHSFEDTGLKNGTSYTYFVSAVYANGESPLTGPASATPTRALYAGDWTFLEAAVDSGTVTDTLLVVNNAGTGTLRMTVYPAAPGQSLDDVRIRRSLDASLLPATWDTLHIDPSESDSLEADIHRIEMLATPDSLVFRISAHRPWGNPDTDFSLSLEFNLDDDADTGEEGDLRVLLGARAWAIDTFPDRLDTLDTFGSYQPAGRPLRTRLAAGDSVAEVSIGRPLPLEGPAMTLVVRFTAGTSTIPLDRAPDRPAFPWLGVPERTLVLSPGATDSLAVRLGHAAARVGPYVAALLIETNDPAAAVVVLPIALTVQPSTPVVLSDFVAEPGVVGARITWRTSAEFEHVGFIVHRREVGPVAGSEVPVSDLVPPSAEGRYEFLDATALPGRHYAYRLADLSRGGHLTWHGPVELTLPGAVLPKALALLPATPNPAPGAALLRWALPAAGPVALHVFSVDGRLVRRLVDGDILDAGWHDRAWDGRDAAGAAAPSGVYLYRLEAGGRSLAGKLLLVR